MKKILKTCATAKTRIRGFLEKNPRFVVAAWIICLAAGLALAHHVEPGVRVKTVMLADDTPALEFLPAGPGPHPVALLAHGYTGSKETLFCYGEALAAAGFVCYDVDQPGHGASPRTFTLRDTVQTLDAVAREVGPVDVFVGHSMGGTTGGEAVREGGMKLKLFIGVGSIPVLGDHAPPLLVLVGRYEFDEFPRELAYLKKRTDARMVISPSCDHILEAWDPLLVYAAVQGACAVVHKTPPPPPTARHWRLLGVLLAFLAARRLALRLPDLFPQLAPFRGLLSAVFWIAAFMLTISGRWVDATPHWRFLPKQAIAMVVVFLLARIVGKLGIRQWGLPALGVILILIGVYWMKVNLSLTAFRFTAFTIVFTVSSMLSLIVGAAIGRIAPRRGPWLQADIRFAIVVGWVAFQFGEWPRMAPDTSKPHVAIKLDAKHLDAFVGTYEFPPDNEYHEKWRLTIRRQGDQLVGHEMGKDWSGDDYEIYPDSETSFFNTFNDNEFIFIKDDKGEVTALIVRYSPSFAFGLWDREGKKLENVQAQEATITVQANQVIHPISRYLTGACLEDVNHEVYGGLYSQMIFGESFQEPAPAETLAGFTEYGGAWQVTNSSLLSVSGPGPKLMDNNVNQSSGDLKVRVQFAANEGGDAGVIFQVSQPGVGADVFKGYEVSLAPAGDLVLSRHRQNWEPISQASCSVPTGQWINLEVQYTNASINVLVNSSNLIQYTDTQYPLASGQIGLRNFRQDVLFRDFRINGAAIPFVQDASTCPGAVSGMWTPVATGSASGQWSLETSNVFVGTQSQEITDTGGTGEFGVANQGLNHRGMTFVAGNEYDGSLDVRADMPTPITLALESSNGIAVYAQTNLLVTSNTWEHLNFSLTPLASNTNGGQFALTLTQPGSVTVGYAFLEPGAWGQFEGLPVRKDVAEGLINQGITVLRYGGSMVNATGYRWTNMIGPRDLRPPYTGTWYPYSSDGWGIPDFLNFCEAAGFLGIPDFNINETPQDMANFVEYANGSTNTQWGAQRAAEGRPQPYGLKYLELGNEERVDSAYYQKFEALARAIWAADSNITLVVGDFSYSQVIKNPFSFGGAASGITTLSAQQKILQLAKQHHREVWFDVHVGTDGPKPDSSLAAMFSYDDALGEIANGAKYKVVVFELNANNHSQRRALANVLAISAAERDGRLPIVTSANCLQPDGENDNGWDQGLLFLNSSKVWLQPPGYITKMIAHDYEPVSIQSRATAPGNALSVSAKRSEDGKTLVLDVVNLSPGATRATIIIHGYSPTRPAAVEELAAPLDMANSAGAPSRVSPIQKKWEANFEKGKAEYDFPPYSFTAIEFDQ